MKNKKIYSFQEWLPFKEILDNGIIKLKDNTYVKIIKVYPINFNLKSELEKEAILNSYKLFLKTCDFDIQILIQSTKQDFSTHIYNLEKEKQKEENTNLSSIYQEYIEFIQQKNQEKNPTSKKFLILIKNPQEKNNTIEKIVIDNLNEKYHKIKECLSRC